jgi:predicted nuclease of restriction endonuclease-like RecB superfamily
LLPRDLLSLTSHDRETTPRYLTARDEAWVAAVVHEVALWVGHTVGERARALKTRSADLAAEHGVAPRLLDGLVHVLVRTYSSAVPCARDPIEVRAVTFEEAARDATFDRPAVLARAATRLGLEPPHIEAGLFADRERSRRIVAPLVPVTTGEAIDAFNLSLVEGLLARSTRVVVEVEPSADDVIRFAKRAGLLCTWVRDDERLRLELSGPLSLLRHTSKYSRTLARFFPALIGRARLRVEAHCLVRDEPVTVHISECDPLFRHTSAPATAAGEATFEQTLVRAIDRLATGWEVEGDPRGHQATNHPDLVLRRGDHTVHVEIIRFHTPEHVQRRLESLPRDGPPTLVCLDETLACVLGTVPGTVLRFRKRLDAATLLNAADALVTTASTRTIDGGA